MTYDQHVYSIKAGSERLLRAGKALGTRVGKAYDGPVQCSPTHSQTPIHHGLWYGQCQHPTSNRAGHLLSGNREKSEGMGNAQYNATLTWGPHGSWLAWPHGHPGFWTWVPLARLLAQWHDIGSGTALGRDQAGSLTGAVRQSAFVRGADVFWTIVTWRLAQAGVPNIGTA